MSIFYMIITASLVFIVGSTVYSLLDAALPMLLTAFIATLLLQAFLIALHRSRKSYIRFTGIELTVIFILTYLVITMVQSIAIIILN